MIRRWLLPFLPVLPLLLAGPAAAQTEEGEEPRGEPFLWVVETDGAPAFLFGTIHLPDERVTDLPPVVLEALDAADAVYGELAPGMATQQQAQMAALLPDGQTLADVIEPELFERVKAIFMAKKVNPMIAQTFLRMKPGLVGAQMGILDYLPELMSGELPLDSVIQQRAVQAGKEVGGLEEAEEQMGAFDALTMEEQILMLESSVEQAETALDEGRSAVEPLLEAYLSGEGQALVDMMTEEDSGLPEELQAKFEREFVVERNHHMADRIAEKIGGDAIYFFAVGTLHYPGEEGIVALLEGKGFTVRRLSHADAGELPIPAGAGAR